MTNQIQILNDKFRKSPINKGQILITRGIQAKSELEVLSILNQVRTFDNFNTDNDPYNEHDFGSFSHNNEKIFWKIDYYDNSLKYGSENPANENETTRVLTVMLAEEY